jgi:hypothetical protein
LKLALQIQGQPRISAQHGLEKRARPSVSQSVLVLSGVAIKWPARGLAPELSAIRRQHKNRHDAIRAAYESRGLRLSTIAKEFGVHFTTVGRIVRQPNEARRCRRRERLGRWFACALMRPSPGVSTPLSCMAHARRAPSAASLARSRTCGSRTAQECGRYIVGTYTHRPLWLGVPCQVLSAYGFSPDT